MDEKIKTLYELCETISRELEDANEKIRKAGGKVSAGDVDYLDKLTHSLKSIKTTIAMMESEEDDEGGYSGRYMPMYGGGMSYERGGNRGGNRGGSSNRGGSYEGGSYARGRIRAKRDSMGRYSREGGYSREDGYSYADSMDELLEEMRGMMGELPEEKRREVQRFVDKMDRM